MAKSLRHASEIPSWRSYFRHNVFLYVVVPKLALEAWFTTEAPYLYALARHSRGTAQSRSFFCVFFFFFKKKKQPSTQMRSKPRTPLHARALDPRLCNERTFAHKTVFSCCCFHAPHRAPPPSIHPALPATTENAVEHAVMFAKCSLTTACGCKITTVPPCNSTYSGKHIF